MHKFVKALRWANDIPGSRVFANSKDGEGAVITYSFAGDGLRSDMHYWSTPGLRSFTSTEKTEIKRFCRKPFVSEFQLSGWRSQWRRSRCSRAGISTDP